MASTSRSAARCSADPSAVPSGPAAGSATTLRSMDPTYDAEAEAYREKIQAFLAEHLPAGWSCIGALPAEEAKPKPEAGPAPEGA